MCPGYSGADSQVGEALVNVRIRVVTQLFFACRQQQTDEVPEEEVMEDPSHLDDRWIIVIAVVFCECRFSSANPELRIQ